MDWAYRMIAAHKLDPLGLAVVMHLGWRDAPAFRTDRGIARALHQHRSSVAKATAKLAAMGIIERRSGLWVAVETVRIVEDRGAKQQPAGVDHSVGQPAKNGVDHSVGHGGPLSGPPKDHSVGHKRKENIEKGRRGRFANVSPARPPVARPMGGGSGGSIRKAGRSQVSAAHAALADPTTSDAEKIQIWDWLAKVQPSPKASAHADV